MVSWASLFVVTMSFFAISAGAAVSSEIPLKGGEKILISVPDAVINVQATSAKTLSVRLLEAAADDFNVQTAGSVIRVEANDKSSKENLGKVSPARKKVIEISGPSLPLEIHLFEGQVNLTRWGKEALVHLQKGRITSREGLASLNLHSQSGEIQVLDHQGRVAVDSYKASLTVRNLTGDADLENFAGETLVDKARGFLSVTQGPGSSKVLSSGGTLQFETTKGVTNIQAFQGRVEGQTQEGPVNVTMTTDSEVNVRSQNGRVTVQTPANSGAALNIATVEGEIQSPSYLPVVREGSQKSLRGRMKGEAGKGSVMVRTQSGVVVIR